MARRALQLLLLNSVGFSSRVLSVSIVIIMSSADTRESVFGCDAGVEVVAVAVILVVLRGWPGVTSFLAPLPVIELEVLY